MTKTYSMQCSPITRFVFVKLFYVRGMPASWTLTIAFTASLYGNQFVMLPKPIAKAYIELGKYPIATYTWRISRFGSEMCQDSSKKSNIIDKIFYQKT